MGTTIERPYCFCCGAGVVMPLGTCTGFVSLKSVPYPSLLFVAVGWNSARTCHWFGNLMFQFLQQIRGVRIDVVGICMATWT
jgi:hypothetical protein